MKKIDARALKPEVQEQSRKQLRKKGHSVQNIADMLEVNPGTVYRWCQLYEHGGVKPDESGQRYMVGSMIWPESFRPGPASR